MKIIGFGTTTTTASTTATTTATTAGELDRSYSSDAFREKFQMKKELGLLEGVAIILGIILGSGM